jgi:hypothetical protein
VSRKKVAKRTAVLGVRRLWAYFVSWIAIVHRFRISPSPVWCEFISPQSESPLSPPHLSATSFSGSSVSYKFSLVFRHSIPACIPRLLHGYTLRKSPYVVTGNTLTPRFDPYELKTFIKLEDYIF